MKKLLKRMGWIRQSGRTDWHEIGFDLVAFAILGLIVYIWRLLNG